MAKAGANSGRAVVVAADELAMRALADTVPVFAPEVEVLQLPAWDCLPYDRSSPALRVMAERLATLHALQAPRKRPQLLLVTANAATQRVPTPFRIRQLTRRLAAGERIDREALIALLGANGYQRTDAVADAGEYAVRGSLIDLFPAGEPTALRLDFFGDEIESVRRFDPADQRTIGPAEAFTLMPASEALLDEATIKRFRARYRETFGANATGDPLYQAVSEGRRLAGMEHWLPLFEESLATLFDHLGENDVWLRDAGHRRRDRRALRFDRRLFRQSHQGDGRPAGQLSPAARPRRSISSGASGTRRRRRCRSISPPRSASRQASKVIDFAVEAPRDFAPERAQNVNVYEAVAVEVRKLARAKKKVVLASYTDRRARAARRTARRSWAEIAGPRRQLAGGAWGQGRRRADRPAARSRLHRRRRRGADRAGHARRPAGPAAAGGARVRTPSSASWRRSAPATWWSTPSMASAAMRG